MRDEEIINTIAMAIIMDAGDARTLINESFDEVGRNDFSMIKEKLAEAHEKIKSAHGKQTDIIQGEIRGEKHPPSLLFTHAQDTLMSINSELLLAKNIINVFSKIDVRLRELEKKLSD